MLIQLIVVLCLKSVLAYTDPMSDDSLTDSAGKRLYNFGLGKRAYSYVSEYKRLPVYNFGLGKRADKSMYDYGLGNRDVDDLSEELDSVDKRAKQYGFGLGKRLTPYNFGLGKKATPYSFGLGKRIAHYNFGLGKRQGKYSFGLGKRDKAYSFGLGKRYLADDDDLQYLPMEDEKRAYEGKYSFGLGKRDYDDSLYGGDDMSYGLDEEIPEREVRKSQQYGFGLGKRSTADDKKTIEHKMN